MDAPTHAITLRQPWVEILLRGKKSWEFRTWPLPMRYVGKPLALHAGQSIDEDACERYGYPPDYLPLGIVRGTVVFGPPVVFSIFCGCAVSVVGARGQVDPAMSACPNFPRYNHGTEKSIWYAWPVEQIEEVEPYAVRGAQGIWRLAGPVQVESAAEKAWQGRLL